MAVAYIAEKLSIKMEAQDYGPPPTETVPAQAVDPVKLEERIVELCQLHAKGITDDIIMADQPMIDAEKRLRALQRLLSMVRECSMATPRV